MLQGNARINQVEAGVREHVESGAIIDVIHAPATVFVVMVCKLNHRGCDVDPVDLLEMGAQSLSEPSHTAAEVQRPSTLKSNSERIKVLKQSGDLSDASLEEFL